MKWHSTRKSKRFSTAWPPIRMRRVSSIFRRQAGARCTARMASQLDVQGQPIGKVEDRTIPGPVGDIPLRLYTPVAAGSEALPVLVYFHGGGWVIGDLETHDALCRTLANESGCKVVAVDYRLAPEHHFPAAAEDAFAAVQWVEANAAEIGVDANRIAVAGDSAGGNLAAVVSQPLARDAKGPHIAFQILDLSRYGHEYRHDFLS